MGKINLFDGAFKKAEKILRVTAILYLISTLIVAIILPLAYILAPLLAIAAIASLCFLMYTLLRTCMVLENSCSIIKDSAYKFQDVGVNIDPAEWLVLFFLWTTIVVLWAFMVGASVAPILLVAGIAWAVTFVSIIFMPALLYWPLIFIFGARENNSEEAMCEIGARLAILPGMFALLITLVAIYAAPYLPFVVAALYAVAICDIPNILFLNVSIPKVFAYMPIPALIEIGRLISKISVISVAIIMSGILMAFKGFKNFVLGLAQSIKEELSKDHGHSLFMQKEAKTEAQPKIVEIERVTSKDVQPDVDPKSFSSTDFYGMASCLACLKGPEFR